jgi:hypothetical protein
VLIDEDSYGFANHVNEDNEKLNTPIAAEEDHRCILIIGGIEIFLPSSPVEARACVADATTEERQPAETIKEEEKERILMYAPIEKEWNSDELLTQWEKELEMLEDWLNNPEPEDGCQWTVMQIVGEEHLAELLKNFSLGVEQKMTAALEPATEEEADNIDFVELYEELESLERRVNMQSRHIQQTKWETGGGAYQPGEKLEEVGVEPTQEEMT